MKKCKKAMAALCLTVGLAAAASFPSMAEWKFDEAVGKWWWQEYDGTYPKSEPEDAGTTFAASMLLDGNGDGLAEYYYFDENGYLYTDTALESLISDNVVRVNGDGAEYDESGVLTVKVLSSKLPKAMACSFINQTYGTLLGKDRAYAESVLGAAVSGAYYSGGMASYVYGGDIRVYYMAGKAVRLYLPAELIFNYERDSYTYAELAEFMEIPTGYFGLSNYDSSELQWYMIDEEERQCVLIREGEFPNEQDGIINRRDYVTVGLYEYNPQ